MFIFVDTYKAAQVMLTKAVEQTDINTTESEQEAHTLLRSQRKRYPPAKYARDLLPNREEDRNKRNELEEEEEKDSDSEAIDEIPRILLANDLPMRGNQIEIFGQEQHVEPRLPSLAPVIISSPLEGENGSPHLPKRSRLAESCKGTSC